MFSVQAVVVHSINNCVVLSEHCRGFIEAVKDFGVLSGTPRSSGWGPKGCGGGWSWWCAHTWLWGLAAGACEVAGVSCRHTRSGGGQGRQQGSKPTLGSLAALGALAVSMLSSGCIVFPLGCVHCCGSW